MRGGGLTFPLHAHHQALLVAAVLTAVALALVDAAVLVVPARVHKVLPDGPLEEALAAFTAVHAIVLAWPREGAPHGGLCVRGLFPSQLPRALPRQAGACWALGQRAERSPRRMQA